MPHPHLRRVFAVLALGLLPLLAGQAQAQEITTTVEVVAADEIRVDFSAPVNVAASGEANFASSALNPAHWLFRGSAIRSGTTITPNGDGTSITFLFRITSGGNIIADPLTASNFFGLAPGPGGLSSITGADPTRRVRGFSISVSPPGPEAELSAALGETGLVGATVTVNLTRTEFEPASGGAIIPANFTLTLTGGATGVTVTGVTRDSATAATLTLGYDGTDLTAATTLSVTVLDAAHTASGDLTTGTVPINTAPTITNPGAQTYLVDAPIDALAVTVSDSENPGGVTVTVAGLPSGLSFSATNLEITGTPDTVSEATVTITAAESGNDDITATFVINVVATLGVVEITAPSAAVAEAALGGTVVTLTFSATTLEDSLPTTPPPFTLDAASVAAGITVAATPAPTRVSGTQATFTLAYAAVGDGLATNTTHNVSVIVAAEAHTLSGILTSANTLAVTSTNQSPAFADGVTIADQDWEQNRSITPLTLPEATGGNGGPVSYQFRPNLPDDMTLTGRVLSGAPGNLNDTGTYSWFASDTDSDTSDSDAAVLSFNIRIFEPLTFGFATPPEASDLIYLVDEAISLTLPAASGGVSPLVYEVGPVSGGAFPGLTFDPATRVVSGSRDTAGSVPLAYSVTDALGAAFPYSSFHPDLFLTIEANTVPAFTQGQSLDDLTFIINVPVSFTLPDLADPDVGNRPLIYRIPGAPGNLPNGLMYDETTRVLSGTPDTVETAAGLIYRARDRDGQFSISAQDLSFSIIVEADAMPDFSGVTTANLTFTVGKAITDVVLPAANGGNGVLTYTLPLTGADGLNFDGATRTLSGTPTFTTTFTAAYTATDRDGDMVTASFTIATEADTTPSFAAIPAQEYLVGVQITPLSLVATGGNRGLTYELGATPDLHDGLTYNAPANPGDAPTLTGTPTAVADARTYTITATDADGSSASVSFSILITEPSATIIAPASLIVNEADADGAQITIKLSHTEFVASPPPSDFTFGGTAGSGTITPGGAARDFFQQDELTLTLSYTTEAGFINSDSTLTITVLAAAHTGDSDLLVDNELAIIATPDLIPTFADPVNSQTYAVGGPVDVTLPAASGGDPPLTYTLTPALPDGLTFDNAADSRAITGTPTGVTALATYTYTATDSDNTSDTGNPPSTVELTFTIEVVIGDLMPTFGGTTIEPLIYTVQTDVSVTLPAASGGNPPLVHTISTGTLPTGMAFDEDTRVLDGTPSTTQASTTYTYTATDTDTGAFLPNDAVNLPFTITVEADSTPVFAGTIADQIYTATTDVGIVTLPTATGGNRDLEYTLIPPLPTGLVFDGAATPPTITGTPAAIAALTQYTYTVTDDDGSLADLLFNLEVQGRPVVITGTDTGTISEGGTSTTGTLEVDSPDGGSTDVVAQTDEDGDYGAFSIVADTRVWTYTLDNTNPAVDALNVGDSLMDTFTVTSAAVPAVTHEVTITINGVNDAPTVTISAPTEGAQVNFGETLTLTATGEDVDSSTLTYQWSANPDIGNFANANAEDTTWTAPASGTDPVTLTLTVTDDATTPLTGMAMVTVNPVAVAITFGGTATGTVTEDDNTDNTATGTLTITNPGGGGTDVVAQTDADGMYGAFTIAVNGEWTYTLDNTDADTDALAAGATADDVFTVAAAAGGTQAVTITVTGANDAPTALIGGTVPAQVDFGADTTIIGSGTDPDTGTTLTYAWSTSPADTGSFSETTTASTIWTAPATPGPVTLILTVTDDATPPLSDTAEATINLIAPTAAISATVPDSLTEANLDGATLTVTLTGTTYDDPLPANPVTLNTAATTAGVTVTAVRDSATEATLTLAFDRAVSDFDTDLDIIVTVAAAAHAGTGDLDTGTVTVTAVAENNNADLSALTLSAGTLTPDFAAATLSYTAMVDNSVSSLTLTPTAADTGATITVAGTAVASGMASGRVDLVEGANAIVVEVAATDGSTTQTYTVTVTRAAASGAATARILETDPATLTEANLDGATLTVTLTNTEYEAAGDLEAAQFPLNSTLPGVVTVSGVSRTDATNVVLTLAYDGTDFDDDGSIVFSDLSSAAHTGTGNLPIHFGATGAVTFTAVIAVVENNNANLSALTLSAGMLTPDFDAATTTYTAMVDNSVSSLTLTPTVAEAGASITVAGTAVASGMASAPVPLDEGPNAIAVEVTATDGSTTLTYTVTVTRAAAVPSPAARIQAVNPSGGGPLSEANLNGSSVLITLSNTDFVASMSVIENATNYRVNGLAGLTISAASFAPASSGVLARVTIEFTYDDTDFDADTEVTVTVLDAVHTGTGDLTTNAETVTAIDETSRLSALSLSEGALDPVFNAGTFAYAASVANSIDGLTVTPTAAAGTTITVDSTPVNSGAASAELALTVGTNTITVAVTAPRADAQDYTLTVTREMALTFGGASTGGVTEDAPTDTATGTLTVTNPNPSGGTEVVAQTDSDGIYGTFTIVAASGAWTYTLDNANSATNALAAGETVTDVFTVVAAADPGAITDVTITITGANDAPTADAGPDQPAVALNATVTLDGSASADPDTGADPANADAIVSYAWTQSSGTNVTLDDATVVSPTFTAPNSAGDLVFSLLVNDGDADSAPATVTITVTDAPAATISATTPSPLTEANLDGATLTVTLTNTTYAPTPVANQFTLAGAGVTGVTVSGVTRAGNTEATLTLAFDRAANDFDANASLTVTVLEAAHTEAGDLLTASVTVEAINESNVATLAGLTLSGSVPLNETFAPATLTYTADVAASVADIMVTPTATDDTGATITVNGNAVNSGAASVAIALTAGGDTDITVVVTAEDLSTTQTYILTVTRAAATTPSAAIASPDSLTEAALDGATVTVMLTNTEYVGTLTANLFTVTLSGGATGVSVNTVVRTSAVLATLTLAYGGTGIDTNTTLGITVLAAGHTGTGNLDTATIPVTATPPPGGALSFGGATIDAQTYTANTAITDLTLPVVTGGTEPYGYALPDRPSGLSFNAMTRVLSGTPDTEQGATSYTYTATDSASSPAAVTLSLVITVEPGPEVIGGGPIEVARSEAMEMTLGTFGRSFASGAVEVLGERFSSVAGGSQLTFGGRTLSLESLTNGQAAVDAGDEPNNQPVSAAAGGHQTSVGALFAGSAFQLSLNEGDAAGVGATTLWARGAVGNYEGEPEDGFQLDGDIVSGYLGLDYRASRRTLVGVAVSHSRGDADFSSAAIADGEVETDLTSILPYVQWQPRPGLSVWGLVGYGEGESEITDSGESRKTDVEMKTAALGARGKLWSGGRADVALKASALTVELESDSEQNLSSVTTRAHRLRMALEGKRHGAASARGGRFGQRFELGLRWDLGDVETGAGADLGAGVEYANPRSGTRLRLDGHYLLVHEESDFEAWEVSAEVGITPSLWGRGVTFALQPGWDSAGARQRMVMDFTNVLGPAWRGDGLKLELYGEHAEDHEFGLEGSVRY